MTLELLDTAISFVVILTALSLLVMTLTQMVSHLLGLRGAQLRWGIATLLREIDPKLAERAEKFDHARIIAEQVLHHQLISDSTVSGLPSFLGFLTSRWRLANGIRKEELVRVLHLLAQEPARNKSAADVEKADTSWQDALRGSLDKLTRRAADDITAAMPKLQELRDKDAGLADRVLDSMASAGSETGGAIEKWFDSVMDRVSQRFTLHASIWTVVFSVALAFALHLDAFKLFTRLSGDAELRARIVAGADAISQKAQDLLPASTNASPAAYTAAMRLLLAAHTNELKNVSPPATLADLGAGRAWLEARLKAANISPTDPWFDEYKGLVSQASLRVAAEGFRALLDDKLTLELVPSPYPVPFFKGWSPAGAEFWGILASAALLSLGAPFWFNLLKNLSSLRPVLAGKMKENPAR